MLGARLLPLVLLGLAACSATDLIPTADTAGTAEDAVVGVVQEAYPDYAFAAEAAQCVVQNASPEELLNLAGETASMSSQGISTLAIAIANRPETVSCLVANKVPVLG